MELLQVLTLLVNSYVQLYNFASTLESKDLFILFCFSGLLGRNVPPNPDYVQFKFTSACS